MKFARMIVAALVVAPLLQACGGAEDESGDGAVRLVNATENQGPLDLYVEESLVTKGVAVDAAGSYVSLGAGTYTLRLKRSGASSTSTSTSYSVTEGTSHTLMAYSSNGSLKTAFFTDAEPVPASGSAKLRVFNASSEAGTVDIYVTETDAALADRTPTVTSLAADRGSTYTELGSGKYRIRVTGTGDKTDLRLDLDGITLASQQVTTLVLTTTPGGVLVHGLFIDQRSNVAPQKNPHARVRLVAGATANGVVAASLNRAVLSAGMKSPAVGAYALVPAGALTGSITVNGAVTGVPTARLVSGSDNTLLVTSRGGTGTATLIPDDNRPSTSSTQARLRLIHGIGGLDGAITLTADYASVITDVQVNTASTAASLTAGTKLRLEVSAPAYNSPLYLEPEVTLSAGKTYSLFMLGEAGAPVGVLRRDR